jgi:hypothetical protein
MRLALAIGLIAVAAAVYIHERWVTTTSCTYGSASSPYAAPCPLDGIVAVASHPTWENPVAVLLAIGGVAGAAGILSVRL